MVFTAGLPSSVLLGPREPVNAWRWVAELLKQNSSLLSFLKEC